MLGMVANSKAGYFQIHETATDSAAELAGGDFAGALKAGDLVGGSASDDSGLFFLLVAKDARDAVARDPFVADAEERRLQDEEAVVADHVGE